MNINDMQAGSQYTATIISKDSAISKGSQCFVLWYHATTNDGLGFVALTIVPIPLSCIQKTYSVSLRIIFIYYTKLDEQTHIIELDAKIQE